MLEIKLALGGPAATFPWSEVFTWAPHLLWVAFALIVFFVIGPARIRDALTRATKIGFAGIEIQLGPQIDRAAQAHNINLPPNLRDRLARRLERLQPLLNAARILWIDDRPAGNLNEIEILRNLGCTIDMALTDDEARLRLSGAVYDIVLSDMCRGGDADAGSKFLPVVRAAMLNPLLIFYVRLVRDVPIGAFGLTDRPDELLHLILDARERQKA